MRRLCLFLFALPLSAQSFAGTIKATFPKDQVPTQLFTWITDGARWQMNLTDDADRVILVRTIFDGVTGVRRERSFLNGKPSAGSAALLPADTIGPQRQPALVALNKTRKFVGFACGDFSFEVSGRKLTGCFAKELGPFIALKPMNPVEANAGKKDAWSMGLPAWATALAGSPLFPLKVWDDKNKTLMEVTAVQPGTGPRCFYEIPDSLPPRITTVTTTTTSSVTMSQADFDRMVRNPNRTEAQVIPQASSAQPCKVP